MSNSRNKVNKITLPAAIQAPIRQRLKIVRESQGISKSSSPWGSYDNLTKWEDNDLSNMRLLDIYRLGEYMGWTFEQTLAYLASDAETPLLETEHEKRMNLLLKNMPEDFRETACAIVEQLVELADKPGPPSAPKPLAVSSRSVMIPPQMDLRRDPTPDEHTISV